MVAYAKQDAHPQPLLTPQEYLAQERNAATKSEYYGGVVVAMAGASWAHTLIVGDLQGELRAQLKGKPCVVVTNNLRVRVPDCNRYYYPDIVVICGEPKFEDAIPDTLLNPTLIIEVLSDSTEATDRGEKWTCFQTLATLQTYVLVSQHRPLMEIYRRQTSGWHYEAVIGLETLVMLDAIGCAFRLADAYQRIVF